ncbi:MAG: hypothetical protein AAFV93_05465, partial [Chloroflexota bacterium]
MAKIYLTYRAGDTTQDELAIVLKQLQNVFGVDSVTVSDADANANIFELYKLVQAHDALLVLIGQRCTTFVDEQGRPLLHSAYDYLYNELLAGLEKDEMWISTLLTDDATLPDAEILPESLQELTRRDTISLHNPTMLTKNIQDLSNRLGILRTQGESSLVKTVNVPVSEIKESDDTSDLLKVMVVLAI